MKRIILFSLILLGVTGLILHRFAYTQEKKPPPPLPPRIEKLDESGKPWKAIDQEAALEFAHQVPPLVTEVLQETPEERLKRLGDKVPTLKDLKRRYLVLDSPILKKKDEPYSDIYEPVRFMHMKHAAVVGDCFACHHHRPKASDSPEIVRCSACHQRKFEEKAKDRPGLEAAFHRRCLECHKQENKGPVSCTGCHPKKVPDHRELVKLPDNPDPFTVTKECLRCHLSAALGLKGSSHWLWRGPSKYTVGYEKRVDLGKGTLTINNFCIAVPSNWPRCTSCHVGYGWRDNSFDFNDLTKMDCLVCHDTTGTYAKVPTDAGMPYPQLDLKAIAMRVGKPSRKNCGDCHFQGGGGDAVKHGDMNSILYYPSRNCDVHMGGMDFKCHECHKTVEHKVAGRSLSVPAVEGIVRCEQCHTEKPHKRHYDDTKEAYNLLIYHLNEHTEHLACQTCHSPLYSKCKPSKIWWDWSKAGDKSRKPEKDKYGEPTYSWMKGEFKWGESIKPTYRWYNGTVKRHLIGDKIQEEPVKLNEPVGNISDKKSKIYPFKIMEGIQMADSVNNTLIVPHLFGPGGYWDKADWQESFKNGMKAVNLPYSGQYKWVKSIMYWGLHHETMPARNALGCAQCHESLTGEKTCNRCHKDQRDVNFKELASSGTDFRWMAERGRDVSHLIGKTDYLDFKALGYKGDPIIYGGRFKKLPLGKEEER